MRRRLFQSSRGQRNVMRVTFESNLQVRCLGIDILSYCMLVVELLIAVGFVECHGGELHWMH
jgi:hypothetical protein